METALASVTAGVVAKCIDYPLDTVKVRMQSPATRYASCQECATSIVKTEGFGSFYRGIMAPILASAAEKLIVFEGFHRTARFIYQHGNGDVEAMAKACLRSRFEPGQRGLATASTSTSNGASYHHDYVSYSTIGMAGGVAGLLVAQILTPFELVKCRLQVQNSLPAYLRSAYLGGVAKTSFQIIQHEGVLTLYRGHLTTMLREVPLNSIYFLTYYSLLRNVCARECHADAPTMKCTDNLSCYHYALCGGAAGVCCSVSYPMDLIKTTQQLYYSRSKTSNLSFWKTFTNIYREQGARGLYRGWGINAFRLLPANAACFVVYEQVLSAARKYRSNKAISVAPPAASTCADVEVHSSALFLEGQIQQNALAKTASITIQKKPDAKTPTLF